MGDQQILEALRNQRPGIQPLSVTVRGQDHRHAVVEVRQEFVRCRRDDRAGLEGFARLFVPSLPQPRESERSGVAKVDEMGLLALPGPNPLVESIGRNQTTPGLDRGSEGRLLGHRLAAGVDHPCTDLLVLGPRRDQTPTDQGELSWALLAGTNNRDGLGGGDVESGLKLLRRVHVKDISQHRGVNDEGKTAAHGSHRNRFRVGWDELSRTTHRSHR